MRAFLVFDPMNDLVFKLADDKFYRHVTSVAIYSGLIDSPKEKVSNDILVHLFAPLLTSQKIYKEQLNNPCACIQCDDETLILFTEYLSYTVIYICNAKDGRHGAEKRRVNSLLQCVWHFYACALPQLRTNFRLDNPRAQLLQTIMKQYDDLKKESLAWLVEARSYYPMHRENQKLLEEVLQSARHKARKAPISFSHAMLFANGQCIAEHSATNALRLNITDLFHVSLAVVNMPMNSHLAFFLSTNFNTAIPYLIFRIDTVCRGTVVLLAEFNELTGRSDAIYALARHVNHLQGEVFKGDSTIDAQHVQQQTALIRSMMAKIYRVMSTGCRTSMSDSESLCLARIELIIRETFDSGLFAKAVADLPHNKDSSNAFLLCQKLSDLQEKVTAAFSQLVLNVAINFKPDPCLFWFQAPHIVANVELSFDLKSKIFADMKQLRAFIFVNRTHNRTLSGCVDEANGTPMRAYLQTAWRKAERIVGEGKNFGFTWADEKFSYRYDIWFENLSGRKVAPTATHRRKTLPYPGVGAVNFYKILTEQLFEGQAKNVRCLELLMIGNRATRLPDTAVTKMSRKLASLLAEGF